MENQNLYNQVIYWQEKCLKMDKVQLMDKTVEDLHTKLIELQTDHYYNVEEKLKSELKKLKHANQTLAEKYNKTITELEDLKQKSKDEPNNVDMVNLLFLTSKFVINTF